LIAIHNLLATWWSVLTSGCTAAAH